MEVGLSIGMAVAVMLVIFFLFRQAELVSANNELRKRMTGLERDGKKLQGQLDAKTNQFAKISTSASKNETESRNQREQLSKLKGELRSLKSNQKDLEAKRNELSSELNRVRIDREELRKSLRQTKGHLTEAGQSAAQLQDANSRVENAEAAAEAARSQMATPEQVARLRSISSLERDLERLQKDQGKLGDSHQRLKRELVKREANLREVKRRNEHNRRAYMITQLQLDLAQDEIYVLKHGTPPPYKHADKQTKRAKLKPEVETVKPDLEMEPIDLTGLADPELEPIFDAFDDAEVDDAEAIEEDVSSGDELATDVYDDEMEASEDEVAPVESVESDPAEVSDEAESEASDEAEPEASDEAVQEEAKSTVKLRKAAPVPDDVDA